ncbi:MAG: ATPase, T2SS/T4P/T4SS family [Lautropia sp.]|nr:ATPase, T2SS/T4P/T4SS family [Lautropia sp.]
MLNVRIEEAGKSARTIQVARFPCRIGRGKDVEVPLSGWRVARVHAELHRVGLGIKLVDMGTIAGTRVNGERVVEYGPLSSSDEIFVAGYRLRVHEEAAQLPQDAEGGVRVGYAARDEVGADGGGEWLDDLDTPSDRFDDHPGAGAGAGAGVGDDDPYDSSPCEKAGPFVSSAALSSKWPQSGRGSQSGGQPQPDKLAAADALMATDQDAQPDERHQPDTARADTGLASQRTLDQAAVMNHAAAPVKAPVEEHAGDDGAHRSARSGSQAQRALHARAVQEQARALGWRRMVHRKLLDMIDLRRSNLAQYSTEQLRAEVQSAVEGIVASLADLPADIDRERLVRDTVDEAVGLGPLERLMVDPLISEIMVNSATDIFVERKGCLEQVPLAFSDDDAIRNVIERIVAPLGRRIDESSPLVDARLPDGSRVNAIIPPVALKGPTITIRRFNRTVMTPDTLVAHGSATAEMMAFLTICVREHKSIVVSGGTGSGKTTLLNVLSNLIPTGERLITIEDAAELKLMHPHLVSLESRPPNAEGRGAITIRDLVKNALRMRPDRIIVGECRGAEALDMMQAMNTGHEGSLTTIHANAPRDVLSRLEVLMLMAGLELPLAALREQVASAVDLIVHQARFPDGSRRITSITEVCGVESGRIQTQEIFRFEQTGQKHAKVQGRFVATQQIPSFYEALRDRGVPVDLGIFENRHAEPLTMAGEHA